jgi:hypothetical protein
MALEAIMAIQAAVRPMRGSDTEDPRIGGPSANETIRAMTELLREGRPAMVVNGVAVAAVTVGVSVEATVRPMSLHAGLRSAVYVALLVVLAACVVRAVALMISASRRLMDELGELRRQIGAPIDPGVPWTPVKTLVPTSPALRQKRMEAVLAAAHYRNARIHQALGWAAMAVICFFAWTLVPLIMAGRM